MEQLLKGKSYNYLEKYIMIRTKEGEKFQSSVVFKKLLDEIKKDCLFYIDNNDVEAALTDIENFILEFGIENYENMHMIFKLLKSNTSMEAIYCWLQLDKRNLEEKLPAYIDVEDIPLINNDLFMHSPLDRIIQICDLYHEKRAKARHLKEFWELKKNPNNYKSLVENLNPSCIAITAYNDYLQDMHIQDIVCSWKYHGLNRPMIKEVLKNLVALDEDIAEKFTQYYEAQHEYEVEEMQIKKRRCFY